MSESIAEYLAREGVTVRELFYCLGRAGHDIADAMGSGDRELGEGASSALCNVLGMLPGELRADLVLALQDRSLLAPELRALAL